ncbi:TPA: DUF58 domain-containing protein [Escherichia coli]|nr:DUF58 domain-containing protein [Escherichia coli]
MKKNKKIRFPVNVLMAKFLQEPGRYAFFAWLILLLTILNPDNSEVKIIFLLFTVIWIYIFFNSVINKKSLFEIETTFPKFITVGQEFSIPIKIKKIKGFKGIWYFRFVEEPKKEKKDKLMRKALFNINSVYWHNRYPLNDSNDYGEEQLSAIALKDISIDIEKKVVNGLVTGKGRRRGVVKFNYLSWSKKDILGWTASGKIKKIKPIEVMIIPNGRKMPAWPSSQAKNAQLKLIKNKSYAKSFTSSDNFIGIREAFPSDPLKYTHWKSWAKTGKRWVIEKEDEISPKMSLVVDLVLDDNDKYRYEKFERMLEMLVGQTLTTKHDKDIEWVMLGEKPIKINMSSRLKWQQVLKEISLAKPKTQEEMNEQWRELNSYWNNVAAIRLLTTRNDVQISEWTNYWKQKGIVVDIIKIPYVENEL